MAARFCRTAQTVFVVLIGITFGQVLLGASGTASAAEIIVESVKPAQAGAAINRYGLTNEGYQRILRTLPGARQVVPVRMMPHQAVRGERMQDIELVGTTAGLTTLDNLNVSQGRWLTSKDIKNRNNIAVIGALTARRLFELDNPVGKNIRIGGHYFLVVGQLEEPEQSAPRGDRTECVYIPLTTMQSRYGDNVINRSAGTIEAVRYELSQIRIVPEDAGDILPMMKVLRTLLEETHERQDYSIRRVDVAFK